VPERKANRNSGRLHCSSPVDAELQGAVNVDEVDKEQAVDNVVLSKIEPLR